MSSDQHDDSDEAEAEVDDEFDADDPDDYGHASGPARRGGQRRSRLVCGEVTARFTDGSLWLACTGDTTTAHHVEDCTGVFDELASVEDYRPPAEPGGPWHPSGGHQS